MAKAIASGDERLMKKAGLEADIARLERLRAAHEDDLFAVRRQIRTRRETSNSQHGGSMRSTSISSVTIQQTVMPLP